MKLAAKIMSRSYYKGKVGGSNVAEFLTEPRGLLISKNRVKVGSKTNMYNQDQDMILIAKRIYLNLVHPEYVYLVSWSLIGFVGEKPIADCTRDEYNLIYERYELYNNVLDTLKTLGEYNKIKARMLSGRR